MQIVDEVVEEGHLLLVFVHLVRVGALRGGGTRGDGERGDDTRDVRVNATLEKRKPQSNAHHAVPRACW